MRQLLVLILLLAPCLPAQDTDRDGLSDAIEQSLLQQFAPQLIVDRADCSGVPAEFLRDLVSPKVNAENGTLYGQVFPLREADGKSRSTAEIHFYHLWRRDCGAHGHDLDTEHVSVLVKAGGPNLASAKWKAVYWFAAAHEDTVCDISQIARASALDAEDHGANVWVSAAKHASFFTGTIVRGGCGKDTFGKTIALSPRRIINLGEPGFPMNGSLWIASPQWPLSVKMSRTDFPAPVIARLEELPVTEVAQASPGPHPAQGVIAISSNTAGAVSSALGSTGNSLEKSYRTTAHSLSGPLGRAGKFVNVLVYGR